MRKFLIFLLFITRNVDAQSIQWAELFGSLETTIKIEDLVNNNDFTYVTGSFEGTFINGGDTLTSKGSSDILVAKLDNTGNPVWTLGFGSLNYDQGLDIEILGFNRIAVIGRFGWGNLNKELVICSDTLTAINETDMFVAIFDFDGNCQWAKTIYRDDAPSDGLVAIGTDHNNNIYVTGGYRGSIIFDTFQMDTQADDLFIAKYNSDGDFIWAKTSASAGCFGYDLVTDRDGDVYVCGSYYSIFTYNNLIVQSVGNLDVFLLKISDAGEGIWLRSGGGISRDEVKDITIDASNNLTLIGTFSNLAIFGNKVVNGSSNTYDSFIVKYDSNGSEIWAKSVNTQPEPLYGFNEGYKIISNENGETFILGKYIGDIILDTITVIGNSDYFSTYIAKLDSDGKFKWGTGIIRSIPAGIDIKNNYVTVTGSVNLNTLFPNYPVEINNGEDFYIAEINDNDVSSISEEMVNIKSISVAQNYPNPFNPTTIISYTLPERKLVRLNVFDVLGKEIITLVNEDKPAGRYEIEFNATHLASGIYFYKLQAGDFVETKKMILMK